MTMWHALQTLFRHRWLDERQSHQAITRAAAERLSRRVTDSERLHMGEIRICVEASLPMSYLWRHVRTHSTMRSVVRQRAIMLFGKLRVWDTERNNGVLIYLLLAEHAIELVCDRALTLAVPAATWEALVAGLASALKAGQFEAGLTHALDEVTALLTQQFPAPPGQDRPNELPNIVVRL